MIPVKLKKITGDIKKYRSRFTIMIVALAISLFAVAIIMTTTSILSREITENYLNTEPAHATIEVDNMNNRALQLVKSNNLVALAEMRDMISLQLLSNSGKWYGLRVFIANDFENLELAKFYQNSGNWPPAQNELLFERTVPDMLSAEIGDTFTIKNSQGEMYNYTYTGTVHDPSLSPAWQEQTVYSYATASFMENITGSAELHDLKIIFKGDNLTQEYIKEKSLEIAEILKSEGVIVKEIMVPPPYRHPHQGQMESILSMLMIFGYLAMILSAILTANMISALLTREIKQIGILKTVGANSKQIFAIYFLITFLIGMISTLLGVFPGIAVGRKLSTVICTLLNFDVVSSVVSGWVYLVMIFSGLLIPLVICLFPLIRSSKITIKEAISESGIQTVNKGKDKSSKKIITLPSIFQMATRNIFRKKKRLLLSLLLLSAAGAMFTTSSNVDKAWSDKVSSVFKKRTWDLEIRLASLEDEEEITNILSSRPDISKHYLSQFYIAIPYDDNEIRVSEIYPDGGHGIFTLRGFDVAKNPYEFDIIAGSDFTGNGENQIILNQSAIKEFPEIEIGDQLSLEVNGVVGTWNLQAITEEIGPNGAFISNNEAMKLISQTSKTNSIYINYDWAQVSNEQETIDSIQQELESKGYIVKMVISETLFKDAIDGHLFIILYTILGMGIILAIVGILGLSSSMSSAIIERKAEIAVIKTIGGSNSKIMVSLLLEGLTIAFISLFTALILSACISAIVGYNLGMMTFSIPLGLSISIKALTTWAAILFAGTILATLFPALTAVELTVSKALAYE